MPSLFDGHPVIAVSNRYYTDRHDMGSNVDLSFSSIMDPHGILASGKAKGLVHLIENAVEYYERKTGMGLESMCVSTTF